jgi:hypothetical protein
MTQSSTASLLRRASDVQRKPLSMSFAPPAGAGKNLSTAADQAEIAPLSDDEALRDHGRIVARAFEIAGYSPKAVQDELRYANQGQISKWTTGLQAAPIHRLYAQLKGFRPAYMKALAEREAAEGNPDVEVETIVRVRTRRLA